MAVEITMKELLEAGVHFGHQTRRWNPKMKEYIFGERNGIHIIDLQKTVRELKKAFLFVRSVATGGANILFYPTAIGWHQSEKAKYGAAQLDAWQTIQRSHAIANGMPRETAEQAVHIVHRGVHCFICLNAYPYSTGHIMIVPYEHLASLAAVPADAANELMLLAQRSELVLREVYSPGGLNMGLNLGEAAGAGIADHIHMHVLPRWLGDTHFMTVTAETRVLHEPLDVTWKKLRAPFKI